ncbi:hypothetical protein KBA63_00040 [Candidatus Woesebacteria bacterium]|nr:hypothetical protein [Candidatus Woesebacteria bacterium]
MAYTPATKIPNLAFFQWSRVDAPNPRLAAPIDDDDTTLTFTSAPLDRDGVVIDGNFLMNIKNSSSFVELVYVPTGEMSADGLTATNVIRGVRINGLDFTTGDSDFAASHGQDAPVGCAISAVYESILQQWALGTVASGGSGLIIGTDADGTVTVSRSTGAGTSVGWVRWNTANDKAQFSNDGASWVNFDSVAASNLVAVSAADTTPNYLQNKINSGDGLTEAIGTPGGDETLNVSVNASDLVSGDFGLEVSGNDIRVDLAATPALEFSTGLQVKVKTAGGITKDSDGLSLTNAFNPVTSYTAYEAITADQALALLPIEVEYLSPLVDADLALGDANARRRYGIKFYPSRVPNFTTLSFRAKENGASVAMVTLTIETDNAGAPSGTAVTNGTAAALDSSGWTTSYGTRTATFPGVPTMVANTAYWLVFSSNTTDAANYVILGVNSTYDENYITFERQTYNLDTATWGSSVTNATPFFWTVSEVKSMGMAVVPTDADFGGRTWSFIGFAKANASAHASVDVYIDTVPDLSLSAGSVYYLSGTAGGITTTKPTTTYDGNVASYKIGLATSATDLLIEKGSKRYKGYLTPTGSATTIHTFVTWFPLDYMEVQGSYLSTANIIDVTQRGLYDGVSHVVRGTREGDGSAPISAFAGTALPTDRSFGFDSNAYWQGVGSSPTGIGFTYTVTKTSTPGDYVIAYEIVGN